MLDFAPKSSSYNSNLEKAKENEETSERLVSQNQEPEAYFGPKFCPGSQQSLYYNHHHSGDHDHHVRGKKSFKDYDKNLDKKIKREEKELKKLIGKRY